MSGIVGSRLNIRGSGLVGSLGTDGQVFTSAGAGKSAVFEDVAGGGIIKQIVTSTTGGNSTANHNGSSWTTLETLGTTITVDQGNKVWFIATSVGWYTSGTNNYNGVVRFNIGDGTNNAQTNAVILHTQNHSLNNIRLYGTSHAGLLTTAGSSGTVTVTATAQARSETAATVYYGDTNSDHSYSYTFMEIIV